LQDATVDLRDLAVTIDRAVAVLDPAVELLEASYAIHRALIVLSDWCRFTRADEKIEA
jgi:hypothetical protein